MAPATGVRPRGAGKAQLHDTALRLFARDGVEGTSLQAIADEMGVTKAAVYYHYKTKEELVLGVVAPIFDQLDTTIRRAETQRGRAARLEELITGVVDVVVDNRSRYAMLIGDPYLSRVVSEHHGTLSWWTRIQAMVAGTEPDHRTRFALMIFLAGLRAPLTAPGFEDLDNETMREFMTDCGRRLLQLRKRPATAG
jgi:AcrR family transcriptional regulator